ncbi:YncE family protein [Bacillus salipaludis]|uniref:YncE family protein n=1 Tax=Bacillus salipaludis TaxID=2547811 RepID=A0A4R5VTK4_9BACI|nr:YncE family protein [Bacillus salipaludis]MDQ6600326.1 YncE family protein [Bacillus salipaludis]TDK62228.1 YncE family protein [Bacillus salipaludis]
MKKYLALFFTSMLILSLFLAGCGNTTNKENGKTEKTQVSITNQEARFLFTANEGGSISKISLNEQKVISTFKFDGAVHNIQVSPNGKVVAATVVPEMMNGHGHDNSMDMTGKAIFFDPIQDKIMKEVKVGNHPAHIVFTENGKYVLVTNNEDNTVSVIDAKNYAIVKTIPTGKGPHGFRISKDSQFAYVANMGEDTVSVLNLQTLKEDKKIKVGETPVTTGITTDGKTLVVTLNKENALAIVDLASGKVDKVKVGNGPAQVYIGPGNQFAYVANQGTADSPSHSITKVVLKSKHVAATIETGKGSHGVVTSPDNKLTYVTNMFENTVNVIDNSQNKVVKTINVGKTPNGISIMP